jgi:hypothetical protein
VDDFGSPKGGDMPEALVNRHAASSRPTPQAHERQDPITQIEELFRLDAQAFEASVSSPIA